MHTRNASDFFCICRLHLLNALAKCIIRGLLCLLVSSSWASSVHAIPQLHIRILASQPEAEDEQPSLSPRDYGYEAILLTPTWVLLHPTLDNAHLCQSLLNAWD